MAVDTEAKNRREFYLKTDMEKTRQIVGQGRHVVCRGIFYCPVKFGNRSNGGWMKYVHIYDGRWRYCPMCGEGLGEIREIGTSCSIFLNNGKVIRGIRTMIKHDKKQRIEIIKDDGVRDFIKKSKILQIVGITADVDVR